MTFETREAYLQFRREWRTKYMTLSTEIREGKIALKNAFRANDSAAYRIQRSLLNNRALAHAMMEQIEAVRQARREQRAEQIAAHKAAA